MAYFTQVYPIYFIIISFVKSEISCFALIEIKFYSHLLRANLLDFSLKVGRYSSFMIENHWFLFSSARSYSRVASGLSEKFMRQFWEATYFTSSKTVRNIYLLNIALLRDTFHFEDCILPRC